jgi:hypothetical protein
MTDFANHQNFIPPFNDISVSQSQLPLDRRLIRGLVYGSVSVKLSVARVTKTLH